LYKNKLTAAISIDLTISMSGTVRVQINPATENCYIYNFVYVFKIFF